MGFFFAHGFYLYTAESFAFRLQMMHECATISHTGSNYACIAALGLYCPVALSASSLGCLLCFLTAHLAIVAPLRYYFLHPVALLLTDAGYCTGVIDFRRSPFVLFVGYLALRDGEDFSFVSFTIDSAWLRFCWAKNISPLLVILF